MAKRRFGELGIGCGKLVYDRAQPEGHLSRRLDRLVNWAVCTERLLRPYKGRAPLGRPPHNPAVT
jgi:hypothetical protein